MRRITVQGPESVAEFYQSMADRCESAQERRLPQCMLDLLRELSAGGSEPVVWGLTSHERLGLRAVDDWQAPSLVSIEPTTSGAWHIECALPADWRPWPAAVVRGHTAELAEAVRRVWIGLRWAGLSVGGADAKQNIAGDREPESRLTG
ncbi:hypothetical protein [Zavarzinella formosa]|uniref:hypothetical protein n=1 Tax=Zavarzinella formosa TaxID=360055 RepID=UPI0012FCF3DB|nr:hypothetical protein [Zavarzinella formosa]